MGKKLCPYCLNDITGTDGKCPKCGHFFSEYDTIDYKESFKTFCKQRLANSAFQDPVNLEQQYYNKFIEELLKRRFV